MSTKIQEFSVSLNDSLPTQQLETAYSAMEQKYIETLNEFNSFKQSSIQSYQKVLQKLEKNKTHNEQFVKKLQKKYENLLHEEKTKATKTIEKLKSEFQKQRLNFREIINSKNQSIQKLSQLLHRAEQEKSRIIEENTQNLISIVRSEQNCLESKKYSHTELMKMYQFLLEENNCLKKQLMKVQMDHSQQRCNSKSGKKKNLTQIFYTEESDKIQSIYVSSQNPSQLVKKKPKSIINTSGIVSQSGTHLISKPKTDHNSKKTKINTSCHINDSLQTNEENSQKRKEFKKPLPPSHNIKKSK